MPIASFARITALALPSLVDEIGSLFEDAVGNTLRVTDTDPEFRRHAKQIDRDALFAQNWHRRAESGARIAAELTPR
jgi:hypothetical protein